MKTERWTLTKGSPLARAVAAPLSAGGSFLVSGVLLFAAALLMLQPFAASAAGAFDEATLVGDIKALLGRRIGVLGTQGSGSARIDASVPHSSGLSARQASMKVLDAASRWNDLSDGARASLKSYMLRPTQVGNAYYYGDPSSVATKSLDTANFRIHYVDDTSSRHCVALPAIDSFTPAADGLSLIAGANGKPDYVDKVAICFETTRSLLCDTVKGWGLDAPPADTAYDPAGSALYDVYLVDLDNGIYGITFPETGNSFDNTHSYIIFENDFAEDEFKKLSDDLMKVTAAHEFFHSVQYGMDPDEDRWFMEMSSTFVEDEIADGVNDYVQYLPGFFASINKSITTFDGLHEYGSGIFLKFVRERFEGSVAEKAAKNVRVVKEIWKKCKATPGPNALASIDAVLTDTALGYDSSLKRAFKEFMIWNYFTGALNPRSKFTGPVISGTDVFADYDPLAAYDSGTHWPLGTTAEMSFYSDDDYDPMGSLVDYPGVTPADTVRSFPALSTRPTGSFPQYLGATYIDFVPLAATRKKLSVTFDGYDSAGWSVMIIKRRSDGLADLEEIPISAAGQDGTISVEEFGIQEKYVRVTMVVMVTTAAAGASKSYSYPFTYSATSGLSFTRSTDIVEAFAYPNPTRSGNATIRFNLMRNADVTVRIYDARGRMVTTLIDGVNMDPAVFPAGHETQWTGLNDDGEAVANGVYFFRVLADNRTEQISETSGKVVVLR